MDYLLQLVSAHRVDLKRNGSIKPGDIVLVSETNLPRQQWKLAKVEELFLGRDQRVRYCSLKLPNRTIINRAINLLYPLELN